jgi:hypothetical protein
MRRVWIMGNMEDALAVSQCAQTLQNVYRFQVMPEKRSIPLRLIDGHGETLFRANLRQGVIVSTAQSAGICAYTGLPREAYLTTAGILGILRYRAMELNRLLCEEDLLHEQPCWCLYAHRLFLEEFALAFEAPRVCNACWAFYQNLCPPDEVEAARAVINYAAALVLPVPQLEQAR